MALDLLARREHSPAELRSKLQSREFRAEEIERVLAGLAQEGLLSERRFVETFIASHVRRGHGPAWIRNELERRGVAAELLGDALAAGGQDWVALARSVRARRFGSQPPADFAGRAKQARFLQYRGFTAEQARAALGPGDTDGGGTEEA